MADSNTQEAPKPKGKWDKLDIVLKPVGGMLTALSVALVGFYGTRALEAGRTAESNVRLYAELMSSREASDSALRQQMFNTIVNRFLSGNTDPQPTADDSARVIKAHYETSVLQLEILAYNFHDSLDLAPLFKDVHRKLAEPDLPENRELAPEDRLVLLERLEKVATEVINKQISALDEVSNVVRESVDLDQFDEDESFIAHPISRKLSYRDGTNMILRAFRVDVLSIDRESKELQVRLVVWDASASDANVEVDPIVDVTFDVGFFDFPLVDNTRLSSGERCALVLTSFEDYAAEIALVFFPGSRASLKDKQFYEDIVKDLRRSPGMRASQR